jgi:hypothetical protein
LETGIRQFVAGTGGAPGGGEIYKDQAPGVQVVETGTSGVLKLHLRASSYSWRFVPIEGQSYHRLGHRLLPLVGTAAAKRREDVFGRAQR